MLNFTTLDKNFLFLKDYFDKSNINFCDFSIGVRYMWRNNFKCEYAIYNDTLILKESSYEHLNYFYYPIGNDIDGAFSEIEKYTKENNIPLCFNWVDNIHTVDICRRFYLTSISNDRKWSDYIYDAESFKNFVGKKYSGQRNHINKFKKTYPNYVIKEITPNDINDIKIFLSEFESKNIFTELTAIEEDNNLKDFIENMFNLLQVGLMIKVDGKIVAISIGEVVNETLIVHVEKALTEYDGVYPFMANEFAKKYAVGKVKYINREEDCGDQGLRISKLQYHPIDVKEKNFIVCNTVFDRIEKPINIYKDEIEIREIALSDSKEYYELYTDNKLNKYWGYDYKEDLKEEPTPKYFYEFQKKLKEKEEEYSLAVVKNDKMIGELVLHNFDYHGAVEIGFRIKKSEQKKGYAYKSTSLLIDYVFNELKVPFIKGKCYKQNTASYSLFNKLGFSLIGEDETYYRFLKKK